MHTEKLINQHLHLIRPQARGDICILIYNLLHIQNYENPQDYRLLADYSFRENRLLFPKHLLRLRHIPLTNRHCNIVL